MAVCVSTTSKYAFRKQYPAQQDVDPQAVKCDMPSNVSDARLAADGHAFSAEHQVRQTFRETIRNRIPTYICQFERNTVQTHPYDTSTVRPLHSYNYDDLQLHEPATRTCDSAVNDLSDGCCGF